MPHHGWSSAADSFSCAGMGGGDAHKMFLADLFGSLLKEKGNNCGLPEHAAAIVVMPRPGLPGQLYGIRTLAECGAS